MSNSSLFTPALLRTHSFVFFAVHETRNILLSPCKVGVMDKFCYLGDMLSVDGDAEAAVARIRIGWNKFRQLVPLLNNKDVSLIMTGRLYSSCVSL